jgi:hypothetical protein
MEDKKHSVSEGQTSSIPSGKVLKDNSLSAAPPFTPGPWRRFGVGAYSDACKDRGLIYECRLIEGTHVKTGTNRANADLIAAAPDMYAALKKIAQYDDEGANARLAATGSFSAFDEPGSVEIARKALPDLQRTSE